MNELTRTIEQFESQSGPTSFYLHDCNLTSQQDETRFVDNLINANKIALTNGVKLWSISFDYSTFSFESGSKLLFSTLKSIDNLTHLSVKSTSGVSIKSLTDYIQSTTSLRNLSLRNSSVTFIFTHPAEAMLNASDELLSALKNNTSIRYLCLDGISGLNLNDAWVAFLRSNPFLTISFDVDPENPIHIQLNKQSEKNIQIRELKNTNPGLFRRLCHELEQDLINEGVEPHKNLLAIVKDVPSLAILATESLLEPIVGNTVDINLFNILPRHLLMVMLKCGELEDYPYDIEYFNRNSEAVIIAFICDRYKITLEENPVQHSEPDLPTIAPMLALAIEENPVQHSEPDLPTIAPMLALALDYPQATQAIAVGLCIAIIILLASLTLGFSLTPSVVVAASIGMISGGFAFFAPLQASLDTENEWVSNTPSTPEVT